MLTKEQVANLKKGDTIVYNNNGAKTEWTVDYPKALINPKHKITVFEGSHPNPKRVALETPAGGGECTNREKGCVRVSMLTPTGRGHQRFSMLVSDFDNWELPEGANAAPSGNDQNTQNPNNTQTGENQTPEGTGTSGESGTTDPVTVEEQPQQEVISLASLDPAPNATNVDPNGSVSFTFSNVVKAGSGMINFAHANGTVSVDVTLNDVSFNGNTVIVTFNTPLDPSTQYEVTVDAGAIIDANTDAPVDVLGNNVYTFTTA